MILCLLSLLRLPLQGRLDYANEMISEIFDSAEKPLTVEEGAFAYLAKVRFHS